MGAITLVSGATTITLPDDLQWTDEFQWSPVGMISSISLTGAGIIEESAQLAGRPITLQSTRSGSFYVAPVSRAVVNALRALSVATDVTMALTLSDDSVYSVRWRHDAAPAFEATPVSHIAPHQDADWYEITMKFRQV